MHWCRSLEFVWNISVNTTVPISDCSPTSHKTIRGSKDHYSSNCWSAFQLNKETMRGSKDHTPQVWNLNAKVWTLMDEKLYFLWINVMGTSPPPAATPQIGRIFCVHQWNLIEGYRGNQMGWHMCGWILWKQNKDDTWLDRYCGQWNGLRPGWMKVIQLDDILIGWWKIPHSNQSPT
jgi:hypothetical protein